MKPIGRMEHNHICQECGGEFNGFKEQLICWSCAGRWIDRMPNRKILYSVEKRGTMSNKIESGGNMTQ